MDFLGSRINPSFPLGPWMDEEDDTLYFYSNGSSFLPPLDESETSESLLKKYFTMPDKAAPKGK